MSSQRDDAIPVKWTMVDTLRPVDLSNIQDRGMKGVALLAVALGWNLHQQRGAPARLRSRSGVVRTLPTDTGVRQSSFWGMIAGVLSHSDGKLPTERLLNEVVKQTGMSRAHAQVLHARLTQMVKGDVTEEPPEEIPPAPEMTDEEKWAWLGEAMTATAEVVEETPLMRIEPTLNMGGGGQQYLSEIMDTVIRQLVPDGGEQITYRCKVCGLELPTKRGVGGHYQIHIRAGVAEATSEKARRKTVSKVVGYQPTEVHVRDPKPPEPVALDPPVGTPTTPDLTALVAAFQQLIDQAVAVAIDDLRQQLDAANAEIARLKSERVALRDLLQ